MPNVDRNAIMKKNEMPNVDRNAIMKKMRCQTLTGTDHHSLSELQQRNKTQCQTIIRYAIRKNDMPTTLQPSGSMNKHWHSNCQNGSEPFGSINKNKRHSTTQRNRVLLSNRGKTFTTVTHAPSQCPHVSTAMHDNYISGQQQLMVKTTPEHFIFELQPLGNTAIMSNADPYKFQPKIRKIPA
jgi:hypothetical protein